MADFEIQYAAHTAVCTFLLDGDGICRRIAMNQAAGQRARDAARAAARCVGAQYVASLDPTMSGLLSEMPKVGTAMLFARTDERGRISLVRTGHVTRFEHFDTSLQDPFTVRQFRAPSPSSPESSSHVATSAPPLTPSMVPTPRRERTQSILPPPDPYADGERLDDRTKPIQALRDLPRARMTAMSDADPTLGAPTSEPPTLRTPIPPPRRNSEVVPRSETVPTKPAARRRAQ